MKRAGKRHNWNNWIGKIIVLAVVLVLGMVAVSAHSEAEFAEAQQLINSKVPCSQLNESQLSMIGDYYMEQMHPGAAHEYMDQMMGGDGSAALEQMHINMAESFYCGTQNYTGAASGNSASGESPYADCGMMGSGGCGSADGYAGRGGYGMMGAGYGMMGYQNGGYDAQNAGGLSNMWGGYGMMGGFGFFGMGLLWLVFIAAAAFVFGIIFWWTKKLMLGKQAPERKK